MTLRVEEGVVNILNKSNTYVVYYKVHQPKKPKCERDKVAYVLFVMNLNNGRSSFIYEQKDGIRSRCRTE